MSANNFCVIEISTGTAESQVFECPLSWWSESANIITYPVGKKFESWKGRLDKPPQSAGAKWICEPGILKAQFPDYKSAAACAKRLESMNTTQEDIYRVIPRNIQSSKALHAFSVESLMNDHKEECVFGEADEMDTTSEAIEEQAVYKNDYNERETYVISTDIASPDILDISSDHWCHSGEQTSRERDRFFIEFAKIHARLDKIAEAISNLGLLINSNSHENKNLEEAYEIDSHKSLRNLLPISNEGQIEKLDLLLRNSTNMRRFIDEMSGFSGVSGRLTGHKVALKLIDKWFKRDFLIECSWTGIGKFKNNAICSTLNVSGNENNEPKAPKKINFSRFKRVIEAFHKVLELADSRFTLHDTENFLKKQLRNAFSRLKQLQNSNTDC